MVHNKKDIISIYDYSKKDIEETLQIASKFDNQKYPELLKDKIVGTIFLEASTRTHLSFVSAAKRLGAQTIRFPSTASSFEQKKESFTDTLRIIQHYTDLLVLRHPYEGAARLAADILDIPVINAGDGSNQHPTQTFIDLYTIKRIMQTLDTLNITFVGDLRFGRTVHSLITALQHFNVHISLVSPENLRLPCEYKALLTKNGINYIESQRLEEVLPHSKILYMTRFQRERFIDENEYTKVEANYSINLEFIEKYAARELKIMHPLPRRNEIASDIDRTHYCHYFTQAKNGITVRKALLALALSKTEEIT